MCLQNCRNLPALENTCYWPAVGNGKGTRTHAFERIVLANPSPSSRSELRVNVLLPRGRGNPNLVMQARAAVIRVEVTNVSGVRSRVCGGQKEKSLENRGAWLPEGWVKFQVSERVRSLPGGEGSTGREVLRKGGVFSVRIRYSFTGGAPVGWGHKVNAVRVRSFERAGTSILGLPRAVRMVKGSRGQESGVS